MIASHTKPSSLSMKRLLAIPDHFSQSSTQFAWLTMQFEANITKVSLDTNNQNRRMIRIKMLHEKKHIQKEFLF